MTSFDLLQLLKSGVAIQRITACEDKWDSWQVGNIHFGDLTEEWSRNMGK